MAITPGQELASETITPTTRAVNRPSQIPCPTNVSSGPEKISAAKELQAMIVTAAVTNPAQALVTTPETLRTSLVLAIEGRDFIVPSQSCPWAQPKCGTNVTMAMSI